MPKTISPLSFYKNKDVSKGQFKQAANDNNSNINSISKALGSHFSSQQGQIKALSANISNIEEKNQQTAKKVDSTNSLLQQSIAVQTNILRTLKMLVNKVEKIENDGIGGEKKEDSLATRLFKGMGITAAAAAVLGVTSFIGNNNIGSNEEQSAEKIPPTATFGSLSEEQKTAVLNAQAKWEGGLKHHPEENNPGNIMFGNFAKKYGAVEGHKNDKITVAKFPSLEAGKQAQRDLWERDYKDMPLDKAIRKWVTGNENSNEVTPGYLKALFDAAGIKNQQNNTTPQQQTTPTQTPQSSSVTTPPSSINKEESSSSKNEGGGIVKESGGITTIQTPISKKTFEVASPYARNFLGFVTDLENSGYKIKEIGGLRRGDPRWHGKGMAIDINPSDNPMVENKGGIIQRWDQPGKQVGSEYQNSKYAFGYGKDNFGSLNVSAMAQKWGLGWGGDWKSKSDTMHFSAGPNEGGEGNSNVASIGSGQSSSISQTQFSSPMRNSPLNMGTINPMRNPLAGIGGLFGPKGAAIGGIAGMLLPTIENLLGNVQGDRSAVMQPGYNYEQSKSKRSVIEQAALKREINTSQETPKQEQQSTQQNQQQNEVTQTATDTRDKPDWIGNFRAGLKHAYLDFDGKMIYI